MMVQQDLSLQLAQDLILMEGRKLKQVVLLAEAHAGCLSVRLTKDIHTLFKTHSLLPETEQTNLGYCRLRSDKINRTK